MLRSIRTGVTLSGKNAKHPASKVAFPKTEVLGKPQFSLLFFCLGLAVLAGCPLATMDDYVIPETNVIIIPTVSDLDLTSQVPRPVAGATPVSAVRWSQYSGVVSWTEKDTGTPLSGIFAVSTAYRAAVTLTPVSGYTFTGVGPNAFSHGGASDVIGSGNNDGTYTVSIEFPATAPVVTPLVPVSDLALTYNIPSPVRGATPVTSFAAAQYAGYVRWDPAHTIFQANTA